MLSFIPLVLFGSLAAAAFVTDDDEDLETDTGASDDDARDAEEMVLGGADLLVEVGAALPAAAPLATAVSWDSFGDDDEDEDDDEDDDTVIVADFGGPVAPLAPADPDVDVISIEVDDDNIFEDDLPGPEAGFLAQLGPGDELTLNIADDVTGRIAAVQAVHDTHAEDGHDILSYSLNFYLVPDDIDLPKDGYEGSETDFIETYEAQKLGELDLGRFETRTDPDSGDVEVTADSRQIEAPQVNSDRDVVILDALFA